MSEPIKKPDYHPESYQPRKPEIVSMAQAQSEDAREARLPAFPAPFQGGPIKPADYDFHFSGFRNLDFTNCFTALYMHLEGIAGGEGCLTLQNQATQHFFLFDTISGCSATVRGWGDIPTAIYSEIYDTEDMVDFVMGYAGYSYEKHTGNLMEHLCKSIDKGMPVLARLKDSKHGSFRVITGYDGDKLLTPEPKGAQNKPKKAPKPSELGSVYVITGRAQRKYALPDALRRIKRVMDRDRESGAWDSYINAFADQWKQWESENMRTFKMKEFKRLLEIAYKGTTWNCHNMQETFETGDRFGTPIWEELNDPRLKELGNRIAYACHLSWSCQWQLRVLPGVRKPTGMQKYSICDMAVMLLKQIKEQDGIIYNAICGMIDILI